jgi:hypothetical protein
MALARVSRDCYFAGMESGRSIVKIRPAVGDDAAEIARVRREAILSKAAGHYDQTILHDWADAGDVGRIGKRISDPDYIVLVAAAGDEMIGFAMAALSKSELQALYTRPNPIGHVGRALLAALEIRAFDVVQFLRCDASLNAENFYKANGYTQECRKDQLSSSGAVISRVVQMIKHRPNSGPG